MVAARWDELQPGIIAGTGIAEPDAGLSFRLLDSVMNNRLRVWILTPANDRRKIMAILTTTEAEDGISGYKSLLIYTLFGYEDLPEEAWEQGFKVLAPFAARSGCERIVGYTRSRSIRKVTKRLGGRAELVMVELEV